MSFPKHTTHHHYLQDVLIKSKLQIKVEPVWVKPMIIIWRGIDTLMSLKGSYNSFFLTHALKIE